MHIKIATNLVSPRNIFLYVFFATLYFRFTLCAEHTSVLEFWLLLPPDYWWRNNQDKDDEAL